MTVQTYRLGVDLGTTYTAAAVARNGRHRVVRLARDRADIPSTVCVTSGESVLVGEQAETMGLQHPTSVARECKRRLGDIVPLILDGKPYSPQTLMAHTLSWTVRTVTEAQGGPPELLTVTCPANWGPFKHELLAQVIRLADVPNAIICTEPEAAAFNHADETELAEGSLIGVYDLGGGTFDAAVLRATRSGAFVLSGPPEGIEHLGGCDFDEAIFAHVLRTLGPEAHELASAPGSDAVIGLADLRRRCVVAKEILSTEPAASIEVSLPGLEATVRLTRPEFEAMIRPALADTMRAFARTLRNAQVKPEDLSAVVLAGGSVRIPLVAETLARNVNCRMVMPVDPSHTVALGAAIAADRYRLPKTSGALPPPPTPPESTRAVTQPPSHQRQRNATIATRELLRLAPGERMRLATWLIKPGSAVEVGQPLGRVVITGGDRSRAAVLRSPYEGTIHRYFVDPGHDLEPADLLVALREVQAYLTRPGRSAPGDTGLTVTINPATTTTAFTGRPVIFVDRVPRTLWWSGTLTVLADSGKHVVSAAYARGNQWFGFASRTVEVPEGDPVRLDYTEPGVGATAMLRVA
jgi:actin-like ATPase involved in cell morphogenesis